mmetsp:Transcript_27363/g.87675  ORF Transcript_27363/g.87675 Transcript_27363/m.87675 type:complete len:530 (-) Transcript_27363:321-1910(-)
MIVSPCGPKGAAALLASRHSIGVHGASLGARPGVPVAARRRCHVRAMSDDAMSAIERVQARLADKERKNAEAKAYAEERERRIEEMEREKEEEEIAKWREQQEAEEQKEKEKVSSMGRKAFNFKSARVTDSMRAVEAGDESGQGKDFLFELGNTDQSSRTTVGARKGLIDDKFVGTFMGVDSDIASGILRKTEVSKLEFLGDDYYICPEFMDAVVMHVVKNILHDSGSFPGNPITPLILGVWGGKGMGKSFQTELIMNRMGANPVIMSAGELESEEAGRPGLIIRDRYRTASSVIKVQGKLSALIINDLDAGVGRFENTQCTVNNQIVQGTLMNLCDHPTRCSVGERYLIDDVLRRVPIIVTGNDFSTLYAPLVRDGRMEKFFWDPSRDDIINMMERMFREDNITREMCGDLVDKFPNQSMDFYGSLKCRMYDDNIRDWAMEKAGATQGTQFVDLPREQLMKATTQLVSRDLTKKVTCHIPQINIDMLVRAGEDLCREQDMVNEHRLSTDYTSKSWSGLPGGSLIGMNG